METLLKVWKTILGISSEEYALFVPGDWLNPLGIGMLMFALGGYPGKEWTFSFCYCRQPLCWLTDSCGMPQTAWLCSTQFLAKDPPGHQSLQQAPHPTVPELLLKQMFWVFLLQRLVYIAPQSRVWWWSLHIIPSPVLLCDTAKFTLRTPALCLSALITALKGACPWVCLWKDTLQFQAELAFACNLCWVGDRNVGPALAICDCSTARGVRAFPRKEDHIQNKTWIITNSGHIWKSVLS